MNRRSFQHWVKLTALSCALAISFAASPLDAHAARKRPRKASRAPASTTKAKAEPSCYSVQYRPKSGTIDRSGSTAFHRIYFKLPHDHFNRSSLCAKVNGIPVPFQISKTRKDILSIESTRDPLSDVIVHYCFGGARCPGSCKLQQDRFMGTLFNEVKSDPSLIREETQNQTTLTELNVSALVGQSLAQQLYKWDEWVSRREKKSCWEEPGSF